MPFQSLDFALFLTGVFVLHWFGTAGDTGRQNLLLLAASLFFYGWWDWRFLGLLIGATLFNLLMARALEGATDKTRRALLLWTAVLSNLSLLFLFKYLDFFVANFTRAFSLFGMRFPVGTLELVLPLGLSFYTFQAIGYVVDVYRGRCPAVRDPVVFMCFMTFFPKMASGPIERASTLVPQFMQARVFDERLAVDGLRRILLGLFMKVVVADNIGVLVERVFQSGPSQSGSDILFGMLLKPLHVYADFAGYSEVAIGSAALFGIGLTRNFAFPFFATDISMLWRRWHMSLTGWFRDFIFMVLPARRSSRWILVRNISLIYLLSGFWHGASWNHLAWGGLNALFVGAYLYFLHFEKRRLFKHPLPGMVSTYLLFSFTMVPLSGDGLRRSVGFASRVFSPSLFHVPSLFLQRQTLVTLSFIVILFAMEWYSRNGPHGFHWLEGIPSRFSRWAVYVIVLMLVWMFSGNPNPFIYGRY